MRIAICDDEVREQERLLQIIQDWNPVCDTECFSDGASLLRAAGSTPPFDIAFLDIYMPGENGIDIAGTLREISPQTGIVFVTTSQDHAVNAFSLNALHYLVKPVTAQGIIEVFRRLAEYHARQRKTLSLSVKGGTYTVLLSQICSLESGNRVVEVLLDDGRQLKTRMPLYELEQKIDKRFLKINRGILVNMDYIERMGTDCCILRNGSRFFLASRRRNAICAAYHDYRFDQLSRQDSVQGAGS